MQQTRPHEPDCALSGTAPRHKTQVSPEKQEWDTENTRRCSETGLRTRLERQQRALGAPKEQDGTSCKFCTVPCSTQSKLELKLCSSYGGI